jgi:hypothetical protein
MKQKMASSSHYFCPKNPAEDWILAVVIKTKSINCSSPATYSTVMDVNRFLLFRYFDLSEQSDKICVFLIDFVCWFKSKIKYLWSQMEGS